MMAFNHSTFSMRDCPLLVVKSSLLLLRNTNLKRPIACYGAFYGPLVENMVDRNRASTLFPRYY